MVPGGTGAGAAAAPGQTGLDDLVAAAWRSRKALRSRARGIVPRGRGGFAAGTGFSFIDHPAAQLRPASPLGATHGRAARRARRRRGARDPSARRTRAEPRPAGRALARADAARA